MDHSDMSMMRFDLPKEQSSIIKVIGVGGGGSNAVNYMYEQGIKGVDFIVCNTDSQALDASPVPMKVQLGSTLTGGRGAGSKPEVGRNAAVENLEDVKAILGNQTTMVFVTAGMGGGTGTGAAPVIARAAREMGILTVGIVTIPFIFEGKRRSSQAEEGLEEMRQSVDTLLVIRNDKLRELFGNLSLKQAFAHADEVLCTAAKGIAEVITLTGEINVDMNDVNTVMRDSGVAIMGSGKASGEGRAQRAVHEALESPLLNDNDITGANFVLLNITYGSDEVKMDEITEITDYIQDCAGQSAEVIWGYGPDETLEDQLCVTVIATGFTMKVVDQSFDTNEGAEPQRHILEDTPKKEITSRVQRPTETPPSPLFAPEASEEEPFIKTVEPTPSASSMGESTNESQTKAADPEPTENPEKVVHQLFDDSPVSSAPEVTNTAPETPTDRITFSPEEVEPKRDNTPIFRDLDGNRVDPNTLQNEPQPTDRIQFGPVENTPPATPVKEEHAPTREEMMRRNRERQERIVEISARLRTPSGLNGLEDEPAYMRRNVRLDDTPHSADNSVSKFSLFEEEDQDGKTRAQLREDNSFLHKNVD